MRIRDVLWFLAGASLGSVVVVLCFLGVRVVDALLVR